MQDAPLAVGASNTRSLLVRPHNATPQNPYDIGMGQLPFYTYVTHPLNVCACGKKEIAVNVANGNLLLHSVEVQIRGTGEDLSIDAYYNSKLNTNYYQEFGQNWNIGLGRDVYLDLSNVSTGVILYGTTNYEAYFAHNTDGSFTSPPGINATLKDNGNSTYTLTYHQSGQKWLFGSNNSLASITDKNGNSISMQESGATTSSITDTQGRVVSVQHNSSGRITHFFSPSSARTSYSYDGNNNLASSSDLLGKTTNYGYTGTDLTTITDARNFVTTITYDGFHRATSITDPLNGVTSFTYNANSTVVTDPNGHATTYAYDSGYKVTTATDAAGHVKLSAFDAASYNVVSTTDALNNKDTFNFNAQGNLTTVTDGNGNKSSATYGNASLPYSPDTATDTQGNKLSYAYDAVGNVTSTKDTLATQNTVGYAYNSNGTLARVTDANGNATAYGYDSQGNLTSVTPPSPLGAETLTRDGLSRVTKVVDGNGKATRYEYNDLDRITKITYNDGTTITRYTYDDNGSQLTLTDSTGVTSFVYDGLNHMTKKTLPDGTVLTYGYDKVGNLTSYTDVGGTVTYGYNAVNLLTSLTEPSGAKTTYSYDNGNRRIGMTLPTSTGISVSYGYDNAGHTLSIKAVKGASTLINFRYVYKANLKSSVTDANGFVTSYSYDALNRMTDSLIKNSAGVQTSDFAYTYDGAGNRLTANVNNGSITTYSYNSANELLKRVQPGNIVTNYAYDGAGNETVNTLQTFTIDQKNQTTAIDTTTAPTTHNTYTYSGATQTDRVQVNGITNVFSALGLSAEGVGSATPVYYTRTNAGQLVNERMTTGTYYYLMDDLGSVVAVVDSSGAVKNTYSYHPYGNAAGQTLTVSNPWRFASGYYDSNTGLYKFGQRYYDTDLGRWTQMDPVGGTVGNPNSGNPYVYANDEPNMLTDPTGRDSNPLLCGLTLGLAAAGIILGGWIAISALATVGTEGLIAGLILTSAGQSFVGGFLTALASGVGGILIAYLSGVCGG